MPKGTWTRKGLEAISSKRGSKAKVIAASQDVLDKHLVKPSDVEVDSMADSLFDATVWERTGSIGVYTAAMSARKVKVAEARKAAKAAKPEAT